jgi:TM2 domain-containing membrane protein YozV
MNKSFVVFSTCIALIFLFSCTVEKRQYRSGYYISRPQILKNTQPDKSNSALTSSFLTYKEFKISHPEKKVELIANLPHTFPIYISKDKTQQLQHKKNTELISASKIIPHNNVKPITLDDEKIKKDVKNLMFSSIAVFLLSLLYGIVSMAGIKWATNLIFILGPFAILCIWVFSLLLYTKYLNADQRNDADIKPKKDRIITKKKAFLLAGIFGIFGVHRFYLGYTKMGILEMLTLGGFFVLFFIDLIRIKTGKLKPKSKDYDPEATTNTKNRKHKALNKSEKLIQIAALISLIALLIIFGFSILF